jgi:site-specific recombinase XerD
MKPIRVTVKVAGRQKERKFSPSTPLRVRRAWKAAMEAKLRKRYPAGSDKVASVGSLKADALSRYLPLVKHLADWVSRRSEIRAWFPHVGDRPRSAISREDVIRIIGTWKQAGVAHRTINNRVSALRDLYRKLDGIDAETPCDHAPFMAPPRMPVQRISPTLINAVLDTLLHRALTTTPRRGRQANHAMQDRARLMVLATTGRRPCEVGRALPMDVNLEQRVWGVRDAKGGWSEGLYLNDEMLIAWRAFFEAEAWGEFPEHFSRRLHDAGWPKGLRPYNVRHSTWIAASEAGADLADIQAGAGQKHMSTTRQHYVPVLNSRMQKLSETIDGRFGWQGSAGDPENIEVKH